LDLLYLLYGRALVFQLFIRGRGDFTPFVIHVLADLRYLPGVFLRALADCLCDFTAHPVHLLTHLRDGQRLVLILFRNQLREAVFRLPDFSGHFRNIRLQPLADVFFQLRD
ncbi:hypothetical protein IP507_004893, partial [Escherichia coli]|nr:hypothetical protein [Escherichia coli]